MSNGDTPATEVWTVARLLNWTRDYFARHEVDEPRLAAEILLAQALDCKRIELYTRFDRIPGAEQLSAFRTSVKQAAAHTPIAYLVGYKEFYSLQFAVTPDVLVPRPETETLVDQALGFVRAQADRAVRILDVGTGSGCIVVALLKALPDAHAVATDLSEAALAIARGNAERCGVADRVECVRADGCDLPAKIVPEGGFELVVSNPPYIAADEMDTLPRSVRDHEPASALTDGADGLSFYRTLAAQVGRLLAREGGLFVEVGETQAGAVRDLFAGCSGWGHLGTWKDAVAGHERVLGFGWSGGRS